MNRYCVSWPALRRLAQPRRTVRSSSQPSLLSWLICWALIAEAFRAVHYPILPKITLTRSRQAIEQILEIRHSSLYCPRDFDISPFFNVVKPTITRGFDYKALHWAEAPSLAAAPVPLVPEAVRAGGGDGTIAA